METYFYFIAKQNIGELKNKQTDLIKYQEVIESYNMK